MPSLVILNTLGKLCNQTPVMTFVSDQMKIALLTTHLPIKDVPSQITSKRIMDVVKSFILTL